ncbi:5'-3' exonuclease [Maribacter phage Molly_3]|uniref:5'-3' exonuclease n=1 Tax=Maribacter phage Molly_1 TaxID=2745685 RepID=A0A8E4UY49_9CAUD|nr:5'-3' exonuclease [Maribacter phage Molly_1]QQO97396.1 5'-3' exonuclease [Maribacter phage Molly_1]QQO97596.1 5'-3' exonuclease [Maribacter phage Molly_2]QQO97796.1 5'-3' exonuclease [Maribacter phage Molly_3]
MLKFKTTVLIVDGDYLLHRSLNTDALRNLHNSKTFPTGVLLGTIRSLKTVIREFEPDMVFFASSGGKCQWRVDLLESYKEKEEDPEKKFSTVQPDELFSSEDLLYKSRKVLKEFLPSLGVRNLSLTGFEADDLGMRLAQRYSLRPDDFDVIMSTDDKDWLQNILYGEMSCYRPIKGELINRDNFLDTQDIELEYYHLLKAIEGDSSDNIPSVAKGLGFVTFKKMVYAIRDSGDPVNVHTIKEFAKTNSSKAAFKNLLNDWDQFILNIRVSDPSEENLPIAQIDPYLNEACVSYAKFNRDTVEEFLKEYELTSLYSLLTEPYFRTLR